MSHYEYIRQAIKGIHNIQVYDEEIPQDVSEGIAIRSINWDSEKLCSFNGTRRLSILYRAPFTESNRLIIENIYLKLKEVKGIKTDTFNSVYRDEKNNQYYEFSADVLI